MLILSHSRDTPLKGELDNTTVLCRAWESAFTLGWSET